MVELTDYYPYGSSRLDERSGSFDEKRKFTGQEFDSDSGLYYMGVRYYDPVDARFNSQDPMFWVMPAKYLLDPQSQNSYAYARNNPLALVDPSGQDWTWASARQGFSQSMQGIAGAAYGTAQGLYSFGAGTANFVAHPIQSLDSTSNLLTQGILAGADLAQSTYNNPGGAFGSLAAGLTAAGTSVVDNKYHGQQVSGGDALYNGAVSSLLTYGFGQLPQTRGANPSAFSRSFFTGAHAQSALLNEFFQTVTQGVADKVKNAVTK